MDDSLLEQFKQKETIEQLKTQNEDLIKHYQELKCQYKELELQKITLIKENYELMTERNKYRNYAHRLKNIVNNVAINITKELNDVKRVTDDFSKMDKNSKSFSDLETNNSVETSPISKNINHVRPMIRGYTIKNPFIVVSRNISNSHSQLMENSTRKSGNNNSSRIHPNSGLSETDNSQELELLNLCVSLRRIDGAVKMRSMRKDKVNVENSENSFSIPTDEDVNDNIVSLSQSPHIVTAEEELSDNCIYIKGVNNELTESYSQQKELSVIPETLEDSYRSIHEKFNDEISKPNKFATSPNSFKKRNHNTLDIDDPLEGPSWLYDCKSEDNQNEIRDDEEYGNIANSKFVAMRKKKKIDTITDVYQSPDSTSEITENLIPGSKYPYHSTPYNQSSTVQKLEFINDKSDLIIKDAKIVIKKLENGNPPCQEKNEKSTKLKKKQTKKRNVNKNEIHDNESNEVNTESHEPQIIQDGQFTSRPRRNVIKSYKEAPLNLKLRRD